MTRSRAHASQTTQRHAWTNSAPLCVLSAQALCDGYHPRAVYLAGIGRNDARDDTLRTINVHGIAARKAWRLACKAGHDSRALAGRATAIRFTVDDEWGVTIPMRGGA